MTDRRFHGRCVQLTTDKIILLSEAGIVELSIDTDSQRCCVGDIVEVVNKDIHILTQNKRHDKSQIWVNRILDPRRRKAMAVREQVESGIATFFKTRGFLGVRTPLLVRSPGMETHIRPYALRTGEFIPTSPEFAMKKMLVGGLEKIFQVCSAFRYEPHSSHHSPEFTILEWYRSYAGYEDIMRDTEELVEFLATSILGAPFLSYGGKQISVKAPWPRLKVRELFLDYVQVDLLKSNTVETLAPHVRSLGLSVDGHDTWDDLYFKIWLNFIEPRLPSDQAVFVYRYPPSQSALSIVDYDSDGSPWACRFEPYAGGLELGNAFAELTDPQEQRRRFIEDMDAREKVYGESFPKNPIDEDFIHALEEGMPPSGGIAMGVDRLVMLVADEPEIDYTFWLPSYVHQNQKS